jgi:hypothetical protein
MFYRELGPYGGVIILGDFLTFTVHWPRGGGLCCRWWVAGRVVREVPVARA